MFRYLKGLIIIHKSKNLQFCIPLFNFYIKPLFIFKKKKYILFLLLL